MQTLQLPPFKWALATENAGLIIESWTNKLENRRFTRKFWSEANFYPKITKKSPIPTFDQLSDLKGKRRFREEDYFNEEKMTFSRIKWRKSWA